MRSWLFAPGDSEKKMAKAMQGRADIVLFDLEDAVTAENKPLARQMVHDFLSANAAAARGYGCGSIRSTGRIRWAISPRSCPRIPAGSCCPRSMAAPMSRSSTITCRLLKSANGIDEGSTPVIVLVTETAEAMFHTGTTRARRAWLR